METRAAELKAEIEAHEAALAAIEAKREELARVERALDELRPSEPKPRKPRAPKGRAREIILDVLAKSDGMTRQQAVDAASAISAEGTEQPPTRGAIFTAFDALTAENTIVEKFEDHDGAPVPVVGVYVIAL
jgi:hypothetical protein